MSSPRITRIDTNVVLRNEWLTNPARNGFSIGNSSLLCVSMPGREAGSWGRLLHFVTRTKTADNAERPFGPQSGQESPTLGANLIISKKKHPAFAGRWAGDAITGGMKKSKGVFDAGALLPQFLAELTITLNTHIWDFHSISARSWQVSGFSAAQIPQPLARELGLGFRHEFPRDSGPS